MSSGSKKEMRDSRHRRIRRKVKGTAERPRLAVMVSGKYMYVQFVDDEKGVTLACASTLGGHAKNNIATARLLGRQAAEAAAQKGIKSVVIDRGGFKFHGRVKAIVDAASEAGVSAGTRKEK